MLALLTVVGGVLAYIFQTVIRRDLRRLVEKISEDGRNAAVAITNVNSGYVLWVQYFTQRKQNLSENSYSHMLIDCAVDTTREAYVFAGKIQDKEGYERLISGISNNLAFYLMCQDKLKDGDKKNAYTLAKSLRDRVKAHGDGVEVYSDCWLSTWAFVLYKLRDDNLLANKKEWVKKEILEALEFVYDEKREDRCDRNYVTEVWQHFCQTNPLDVIRKLKKGL